MENERELLQAISEGDEKAFRELFGHYYPKVKVYLKRFIDNEDDAKDLAQNVFVKIWTTRDILPEIRSFGAYLHIITRNAALDRCRARHIPLPLEEVTEEEQKSGTGTDLPFIAKETGIRIAARIRKMPRKRRRILLMSKFEGKSNADIAEELDLSKKTVESHLYLAMKELKKILGVLAVIIAKIPGLF